MGGRFILADLDDDDASPVGQLGREAEFHPQVDDRDDPPAQVDHALDECRGLRHRRDFLQADNLANLEDADAESFVPDDNGQKFAGVASRSWCGGAHGVVLVEEFVSGGGTMTVPGSGRQIAAVA